MHNCNSTRKSLTDLALNEISASQKESVLIELKACADCREEFAAIRETLRVSERALALASPDESFWTGYHERLAQRLARPAAPLAPAASSGTSRFWQLVKAIATASVRVPAPVAAGLLALFFGAGILLADRWKPPAGTKNSPEPQVITQTITVPQEKVVTRVVYVERNRNRSRTRQAELKGTEPTQDRVANSSAAPTQDTPDPAAMSLVGFKPTDQVQLKIMKGSYRDER
jgi:hypothetical protein